MLVILAPPRVELQESGGSSHNVNILEMLRVNISHSHSDSGVMTGHILWIPSAGCTDEYTWYHRGLCPSFFLIWQRQLACLCPVVIYNQSPIHPWMCPPAAAASPSLVPPCGVNVNVEQASGPSSHYRRSLLKDVCEAPLNVCCDNVSRVCVCFPRASIDRGAPLSNSMFDPSLKPHNLVSPVRPSSGSSRHDGTHAGSDPRSGASIPSSSPPWPRIDTGHWTRPSAAATCERMT